MLVVRRANATPLSKRKAALCRALVAMEVTTMPDWRPMAEFDRSKPALVHDGLNDEVVDWKPELYQEHYDQYAHPEFNPGVTEWDGRLLEGWKPV